MIEVELALSWSLRLHYAKNMGQQLFGREGTAICNGTLQVYDSMRLRHYGFTGDVLERDKPMCRRCERLAVGAGYQVRT